MKKVIEIDKFNRQRPRTKIKEEKRGVMIIKLIIS